MARPKPAAGPQDIWNDDLAKAAALQGKDIDVRELKAVVAKVYPRGDPLREAILKEPDFLTRDEAGIKFEIYLRMILAPKQRP